MLKPNQTNNFHTTPHPDTSYFSEISTPNPGHPKPSHFTTMWKHPYYGGVFFLKRVNLSAWWTVTEMVRYQQRWRTWLGPPHKWTTTWQVRVPVGWRSVIHLTQVDGFVGKGLGPGSSGKGLKFGFLEAPKNRGHKEVRGSQKGISNTNHYQSWKGLVYLFDKQHNDWKLQKPTVMRGGYPIGSDEWSFLLGCQSALPGTRSPTPTQFDTVSEHPKVFTPSKPSKKSTGNKWSSFAIIYWNVGFVVAFHRL